MKTNIALIISASIVNLVNGALLGSEYEKPKSPQETKPNTSATPAISTNTSYRDVGDSLYIPLTMAECNAVCIKESQGSSGFSTKGAGNALDNTSAWPKEAKYVACYGSVGKLWVYQKEGGDWSRVKGVIPEDATVHLIIWNPKRL